ncbi:MAG: HAD family hydrolase [Flavobacteriales bacterium]|tara:strand:+ start:1040 stop:1660 length:621 start_codon:yes stop_codon:yes gene_type:complete
MKKIKSIIFDLGAVLLNISYQKTIEEFDKLGIKNSSTFYSKKLQTNIFNLLETGEISESDFIKEIQKHCTEATNTQILYAWNAMLLDLPLHRVELLKQLKTEYNIYLLSNTNKIHISEFENKLGKEQYNEFYQLFDKVYYSHKIGCRKPNAEAFKIIIEENNLIAEEILFIDDSPQHIDGAKKLGIKTYHLLDDEDVITLFPGKVR